MFVEKMISKRKYGREKEKEMLTFAEQLAQLEAEVAQVSGLSLKQFDELASYVSRVSAMTGLSIEDVTQILQGASAHTGISMSDLAKTLEDLVIEIKEKGGEDMPQYNYRHKNLGNYKKYPVHEVSLSDYLTLLHNNMIGKDIYYVISEDLNVIHNGWIIGSITTNRRNITETGNSISARRHYNDELQKRSSVGLGQKVMSASNKETLISARPTIATYVKEGEKRMTEQARRGRELIESLKRSENG